MQCFCTATAELRGLFWGRNFQDWIPGAKSASSEISSGWKIIDISDEMQRKLWSYLRIHNFSSLCLIYLAALGGPMCLELLCYYRKICICNLFSCSCLSSYLFCAQSAEDPELPVITANGAVPHHLLPLLVKEPCSTKTLQNWVIDMYNVHQCEKLFRLTWRHPRRASCPGFHHRMQTCSLHLRLEPAEGGM